MGCDGFQVKVASVFIVLEAMHAVVLHLNSTQVNSSAASAVAV
jgi:hypothetical protein